LLNVLFFSVSFFYLRMCLLECIAESFNESR
jgi:hypothetical protein